MLTGATTAIPLPLKDSRTRAPALAEYIVVPPAAELDLARRQLAVYDTACARSDTRTVDTSVPSAQALQLPAVSRARTR